MMRWRLVLLLCCLGVVSWSVANARNLSDLNRESFEGDKAEEPTDAGESPFVPKSKTKEELTIDDLILTGVAVGQQESFALISGVMVRVGERVAGHRVRQIGLDHVVLQQLDKRVILRLQGGL